VSSEIELKLEVAPGAAEELMRQPWLEGGKRRSQQQLSIYYDTKGNDLRRLGYTLRVRSVGDEYVQTVKSIETGAGLFARGEWEYQIGGPEPDQERLSHTPLAGVSVEDLRPVLEAEVQRTWCLIKDKRSEIELDVDEGTLVADGRSLPVNEVEIELLRGDASSAVDLAKRIASHFPVKLGVLSKAERGFALIEGRIGKASKAEPVQVRQDMTVADGFHAIIMACLRHFRLNEPLVIEQRKVEALHQARVAMRRLRSAFTLFRTAIGDDEFAHIRDELRWFTGELGDARNLDVYLQRKCGHKERAALEEKRERAYDRVIEAMNSQRSRTLTLDVVAWASLGEWRRRPSATMNLAPYVNRRIDRLWHRIVAERDLGDMEPDERHRLRIRIKKLRYALEFVEQLHAHERRRQKRFASAVEDLQEALGELNDLIVARSIVSADAWPILPDQGSEEERELLHRAEHALDRLRKIGAYWRDRGA
jgi:inorganic triphosphatase YgiF